MVGNLALRRHISAVIKCDFRLYIQQYTSPKQNFEYGYPNSNVLLQFCFERCELHKALCHPTKCDIISHIKLFSTVNNMQYTV